MIGAAKSRAIDLTGQHYGRLTVIKREDSYMAPSGSVRALWLCLCDPDLGGCSTECVVNARDLRSGFTRSCGCLRKEKARTAKTRHSGEADAK